MRETIIRAAIDNPMDGIIPDFNIFGTEFTELWQKILAGVWGIGIIIAIVFIILGAVGMSSSSAGGNPQEHKTARKQFFGALIALAVLAALAVIVGAVLALVG